MKKGSFALFVTLILALVGVGVSVLTIYEHLLLQLSEQTGLTLESGLCTVGATFNCKKVIGSEWSYLFGLPLGYFGVCFYLLLVALTVTAFDERFVERALAGGTLLTMALFASAFSVYLFLVSTLKIGALCPLCLTTYVINFMLILSTYLIGTEVPFPVRIRRGIAGVVQFPLLLLRIGAPSESFAPAIARIWLVAGVLALSLLWTLPDFLANQFVVPKIERAENSDRVSKGPEQWRAAAPQGVRVSLGGGLQGDFYKGQADRPVVIVEFSDFECPACRGAHFALEPVLKEFEPQILFVHKDYPLDHACNPNIPGPFHHMACVAAEMARCAGEQGKFWETAAFLFESPLLERSDHIEQAKEELINSSAILGLDGPALRECIASDRHVPKIKADIAEGDALGLAGTPSFWVNGKKLEVFHPQVLRSVIQEILGGSGKASEHKPQPVEQ